MNGEPPINEESPSLKFLQAKPLQGMFLPLQTWSIGLNIFSGEKLGRKKANDNMLVIGQDVDNCK